MFSACRQLRDEDEKIGPRQIKCTIDESRAGANEMQREMQIKQAKKGYMRAQRTEELVKSRRVLEEVVEVGQVVLEMEFACRQRGQ